MSEKFGRVERAVCALVENELARFEVMRMVEEEMDGGTCSVARDPEVVAFSLVKKHWASVYFWWGTFEEDAWGSLGIYRPGRFALYVVLTEQGRHLAEDIFSIPKPEDRT